MRHWIKTCDETHQCTKAPAELGLPKRLLSTNYEIQGGVRLCSTNDLSLDTRYTTLSYVGGMRFADWAGLWGATLSNLAQLYQGIDYALLGQTLQDAIRVTHALGIGYIWIDTFCIVQDAVDEWQEDMLQLESIYSNAYCVIVASSALDATEGFLKRTQRSRAIVPLKSNDDITISICEFIDDFQKDVDGSPHSTRGWAFQERVLAKRVIFFTSTQMYWQCGAGIRCETLTKLQK